MSSKNVCLSLPRHFWALQVQLQFVFNFVTLTDQLINEGDSVAGIVRGSLNRIVTRSLLAEFWAPPELTNTAFGHPPLLLANLLHILQCQGELTSIA